MGMASAPASRRTEPTGAPRPTQKPLAKLPSRMRTRQPTAGGLGRSQLFSWTWQTHAVSLELHEGWRRFDLTPPFEITDVLTPQVVTSCRFGVSFRTGAGFRPLGGGI